jgi:Na+/proline symporter
VSLLALQTAPLSLPRQPAVLLTAAAYALITAAIGIWASRRTRSAADFFTAGRRLGPFALGVAAMASTLSGFTFIGGPGLLYSVGLGALLIFLPASLSNCLSAWVLAKRLRLLGEARNLLTIPDAIGVRYHSPAAQGLAAVAMLVAIVGYLATNLLALGLVIDALFATGLGTGIWIGTAAVLAYSVAGGILAGVYTDVFQGVVMAIASGLVFLAALRVGGGLGQMSATILAREPAFLGPWGTLAPLAGLSFFFVFGVGVLGQPHVLHKFYMLKDPLRLRWYPLIMTLAMVVTLLLLFGVGLVMKAEVIRGALPPLGRPDDATPVFLLRFVSPWVAGMLFAGVAAAIMSTVNSFLNVGAAAISHDLPRAVGRRGGNALRTGRLATLAIGLLAASVAQASGTLVAFLGIFGWGLFAATLVPSLAIGLNWKGGTRAGAIASIAVGLGATLVGETLGFLRVYALPHGVTVSGLALVLALLTYLGVSRLTRASTPELEPDVKLVLEL